VVQTGEGNPFAKVLDSFEDRADADKFRDLFQLDKTKGGGRHGQHIDLSDITIQSVIDAVGPKNWDVFELYGWRKAALSQFDSRGLRYPGQSEDQSPGLMRQRIAEVEANHPEWEDQFSRINEYMDQLLLVPVLSSEITQRTRSPSPRPMTPTGRCPDPSSVSRKSEAAAVPNPRLASSGHSARKFPLPTPSKR